MKKSLTLNLPRSNLRLLKRSQSGVEAIAFGGLSNTSKNSH